jgi:hypothetical protein
MADQPPIERIYINGHFYTINAGTFQELDPEQFAPKQHEGDPGYADSLSISTFAQDDFRGGYGLRRYGLHLAEGEVRDRTHEVENAETVHPGMVLPAFKVYSTDVGLAIKQFIQFGGDLYGLGGQKCLKQSDFATNAWATDKDFGAGVDLLPGCAGIYSGSTAIAKLYVGIGSAGYFYYRDASSWNQHASQKASLFRAVGGDDSTDYKDVLLLAELPNTVKVSGDGATWGSSYYIGDADVDITSLFDYDEYWFAGKENGMFTMFSNGIVRALARDVIRHPDNCRAVCDWGNIMWFNVGLGLYGFTGGQLVNVGANEKLRLEVPTADESDLQGRITCVLGGHPRWLFAIMKTLSGKYFLMKFDGDPTPGRGWHPVWTPGGTTAITALYIHQKEGENPRLMMAVGTAIAYMVLSEYSDDGLLDPNCRFTSYGTVGLPAHSLNLPNVQKAFVAIHADISHRYLAAGVPVIGEDPDDETFVDLIYSIDGGAEETLARVYEAGQLHREFSIPTTGKWLALKVGLGSSDASGEKCPLVHLLMAEEELILQPRQEWQVDILVGDGIDRRESRGLEQQLVDLETARGAGPVDVTTIRGEQKVGLVRALPKRALNQREKEMFKTAAWVVPVVIREYGARSVAYYFDDEEARFDTAIFA